MSEFTLLLTRELGDKALRSMTTRERREHARLLRLWATRRATRAQMLRCMELDRKARAQ